MEQLTIKHLGRRLAYEPMLSVPKIYDGFTCKLVVHNYSNSFKNGMNINTAIQDNAKIILRDFSFLTKEITHKGEKFVPIEKLYKERDCDAEYDFLYDLEDDWASADEKIVFAPYSIIEKLLSWHFHLDEPEGTWIDVNTLPKNPYE